MERVSKNDVANSLIRMANKSRADMPNMKIITK